MSKDHFLDITELKESSIKVIYVDSHNKKTNKKITIFEDETCKDIYIKLAQESKQSITSDHIYAWFIHESMIYSLGFSYIGITMDDPYKHKTLDKSFVTDEGERILVNADTNPMNMIIDSFPIKTLYFTTCLDYCESLKLKPLRKITDEMCNDITGFTIPELYNGKLRKYWPRLTQEDIFNYENSKGIVDKIKLETDIFKRTIHQLDIVYSTKVKVVPSEFTIPVFTVSNNSETNTIHLFRLFSDISLGNIDIHTIPFSKIILDDYTSTHCKLLKDSISLSGINKDRFITKELFLKWFRGHVTSIPNTPLSYMDERNSISFKLYKESSYVTLIIYSNGLAKIMFSDIPSLQFTKSYIKEMISFTNKFIDYLNKKKIYSNKAIDLVNTSYESSFSFMTSSLIYPIKDYKMDLFITMIENMTTFIRFNRHQDMWISGIYKRVNNYDSISSRLRVISLLHYSKRKLKKEEIILEIEKIFNISNEEAIDEYEQWFTLSNGGKIMQNSENGVELIIDLVGTNIKVDISGVEDYNEFTRIYKFINFMMTSYQLFMDTKKDPHNLFKKSKEGQQYERIEEQLLIDQFENDIQEDIEDVEINEEEIIGEQVESVLENKESKEENIQSQLSSGTINESESSLRLSKTVESTKMDSSEAIESAIESEESDDSFEMTRLEDSDSSGGGQVKTHLQRGGYNVNRYYLSRLNRFDKELFSGYSVKQHKSQKQGTQKYTYAGKCGAVIGRQPVAITKQDLDRYNEGPEGEGISFSEAVTVDGRDPNIYYICPKYWDVKDERPRDPSKFNEFKDHIVDNKMNAQGKKNTDNYILRRDEGGYWDEAGDDITRYKIELWDNFHPKGYKVPCCRAPREGFDAFTKGWKVDVLIDVHGKMEWKTGIVKSSTKKTVTVTRGGKSITYDKKLVRRHKDSKYITNSFPCTLGSYGHINPSIKQLVQQDINRPELVEGGNIGLVRKGVKRGTGIGDHSLLESLCEILSTSNSSIVELRKNIIHDLKNHPNLLSIAGGAFINKFKMDINEFNDKHSMRFTGILKKKHPFAQRFFALFKDKKDKDGKTFSKKEVLRRITLKGSTKERSIINQEIKSYSSIVQFKNYINDENEIILDTYICPVLMSISKYPSKTFGQPLPNLSIITFEGNNEDVIISPYMDGLPQQSDTMILIYKERGHLYEPILYRRYDNHKGIIGLYNDSFIDQNESMTTILTSIQGEIDNYINDNLVVDTLMDVDELENVMSQCKLSVQSYIHDNYNKIVYILTDNNVLIPVRPSPIGDKTDIIYLPMIKDYPTYEDVIKTLQKIDNISTFKNYLDTGGLSVVGFWEMKQGKGQGKKKQFLTKINEIILESGHYIPVQKEVYDERKHTLDIITNQSYKDVDNQLGIYSITNDKRTDYILENDYKKTIKELFFQKTYIMIKEKARLYNQLMSIKNHPIKLRIHKSKEIYDIIDSLVRKEVVDFDKIDFDVSLDDEYKHKVILRNTDDHSCEEIYHKLLRLFIELFIIYGESDYDRFLQVDVNITKVKQMLKLNELLISYPDVRNENYVDHFIRYSQYIRNESLYGEGISKSKLIQLHRMKEKQLEKRNDEFVKQYPQIIHTLFGRGLKLLNYKNEQTSEYQVISDILIDVISDEQEMNVEMIEQVIGELKDKLSLDDLSILSKEFNVGFCLVTKRITKRLEHDVIIEIHRQSDDLPMILLYQTDTSLIHIKRKDEETTKLIDLQSKLFLKYMN